MFNQRDIKPTRLRIHADYAKDILDTVLLDISDISCPIENWPWCIHDTALIQYYNFNKILKAKSSQLPFQTNM